MGKVDKKKKKEKLPKKDKVVKVKKDKKVKSSSQVERFKRMAKSSYSVIIVGVVVLAIFVIATCSMLLVSRNTSNTSTYFNQYQLATKDLMAQAQNYAVTGKITYYDNYNRELNTNKTRDKIWEKLQKCHISTEEKDRLESINKLTKDLLPYEEETIQLVMDKKLDEAVAIIYGDSYTGIVDRIESMMDRCTENIAKEAQVKVTIAGIGMLLSGICFVALFVYMLRNNIVAIKFSEKELLKPIMDISQHIIALSEGKLDGEIDMKTDDSEVGQMVQAIIFMKKNFSNMITEISHVLEKMGNGDYKVELQQDYVGEFEKIKNSMNMIITETVETLSTIRNVAEEINCGADQLAKASEDLAEGSSIQLDRITTVASLVKDLHTTMETHVKEADITVQLSTKAANTLTEGNKNMELLKDAIANIEDCSIQISSIISTIQDIADETNLLSLNASIEAARAGEAGRGFAVVAEQVKKLADESAKAAGETTKLIDTTVQAVQRGIVIADEAIANMGEVYEDTKVATSKMQDMAVNLKYESNNINKIHKNIDEVAMIVDDNSATSEETAAVSEEQAAQVTTMVGLLEHFNV